MIYNITQIDELAEEIRRLLEGEDPPLAVAALCKTIVLLAEDEDDLDNACRWIDEFREDNDGG